MTDRTFTIDLTVAEGWALTDLIRGARYQAGLRYGQALTAGDEAAQQVATVEWRRLDTLSQRIQSGQARLALATA